MPGEEIYGPALHAVNNGVSQTFDYGIGMTCLTLFLIVSLYLNWWLIRTFITTVKDMVLLIGSLKEKLDAH